MPKPSVRPFKRAIDYTHEDVGAALPPQIKRIMDGLGVQFKKGEKLSGYNNMGSTASVRYNDPRTIEINDVENFKKGPNQTLGHEITHLWQNNLPGVIREHIPPDNQKDPYGISNIDKLRSQGHTLATIPREQGSAIVQMYVARPSERERLQPWIDDLENIPMTSNIGTDPDAKEINLGVHPPQPPMSYYGQTLPYGTKPRGPAPRKKP